MRNKEKLKQDIHRLRNSIVDINIENNDDRLENENNNEVVQTMEKLQAIQVQMVGGEKANDIELKEKRAKKKKIAEAKYNSIAETLSAINDDDKVLLRAYGDISEELRAKSVLMKKAKRKIQTLEQEVRDLQSEFERDRVDYLEEIRRQNQQLALFMQVFEYIQPMHKDRCRYSTIDEIRNESKWDDNIQQWILPQLEANRIRLPPAVSNSTSSEPITNNKYRPDSPTIVFDNDIIDRPGTDDKLLNKIKIPIMLNMYRIILCPNDVNSY